MAHDKTSRHGGGKLKIKGVEPTKRPRRRRRHVSEEDAKEKGDDSFVDGYPGSDFDESTLGPDERRNRDNRRNTSEEIAHNDSREAPPNSGNSSQYFLRHRIPSPPPVSVGEDVLPPRWRYEGIGSGSSSSVLNIANHHLRNEAGGLLNCVVFNNAMDDEVS